MDKAAFLDFVLEVVRRIDHEPGFKVLPRRWVVERTFGWMTRWRRPGGATTSSAIDVSEAMIHVAMGRLLLRPHQPLKTFLKTDLSQVRPGAHAVVILDQAGWHTTGRLDIPDNITLLPLPPRSPGAEPGGKRLAVPTRQLAVQSGVPLLRRDRRIVLRCREQADRPALENHVHRPSPVGLSVLNNAGWY